jgi:hypothetical protein
MQQKRTVDFQKKCAEWKSLVEDMGKMTLPGVKATDES